MLIYESGTYICESCNKNACINDTFRVRIDGREKKPECVKPSHIITPASHYSELRLNCDCTSSSFPWTIHWLSFKKEPSESTAIKTRYQTYNTTNHNTTRTIRIYENETRESTERCVATNIHGDVHRDYLLSVKNGSIEVSWPQAKSLHQEKNNLLQPDQSWTSSQNVITLCLVLVFLIVIAFILRCRHDNVQNSRTYAETTTLTISVKRVVVKRANNHYETISETLEMPSVTIQSIETEYNAYPANIEYLMAPDENWEFPRDNLIFGRIIGEGEFGIVMEALANGLSGKNIATTVAVKMLKDNHDDTDMVDLVSEMELMKILGKHHNILCLLGCCTQKGPLYVITEYAQNGNLQDYLRQHCHNRTHRPDASTLISYALQIAQGMKHLASVKCIHRDLAARNILVTEDLTMKVADFGLARDIRNAYYYRKTSDGRLPLRWMAPESISHCLYTFKTDVWSYGVLLWEIETLGGIPYPLITDMNKLIEELDKGYRLEKPSHCCDQMYQMMQHCWQTEPENRPNFSTIVDTLTEILNNFNHDGSSHTEAPSTSMDAESKNHDLTFTTEKHHIYENIS